MLLSRLAFYSYATALTDKPRTVYRKATPASRSTLEKHLSALVPRKKTFTLSVKIMLLKTKRLIWHDLSDRKESWAVSAKGRFQLRIGAVSGHFQSQQEMVVLGKQKNRCPPLIN